jgi:hypothetical protein
MNLLVGTKKEQEMFSVGLVDFPIEIRMAFTLWLTLIFSLTNSDCMPNHSNNFISRQNRLMTKVLSQPVTQVSK